jgi:hypothetical protein
MPLFAAAIRLRNFLHSWPRRCATRFFSLGGGQL